MSANIDSMMYVGESPWHGLGHQYETAPSTPEEIITAAKLDWTTADIPMKTNLHDSVFNYKAIYREDTKDVLGVVNKADFIHVQNTEMFSAFRDIIGSEVITETAAGLDRGCQVFGCFKIAESYKIFDDDIDHYFVVVNNHLAGNGKITVLNTPIRVVCMNTLNAALDTNSAKISFNISNDPFVNRELAHKIMDSAGSALDKLAKKADDMIKVKIDKAYIDRLLDNLFPYIEVKEGDFSMHEKANEQISMMRDTFVSKCIHADNLANYNGTMYQVFNAVADYSQHYYLNIDKSYDLKYRMSTVLGSADTTQPVGLTTKFMKFQKALNKVA